jgi:uncharacterized protein YbaP (TraB family)
MDRAFDDAEQVVFEADPGQLTDLTSSMRVLEKAMPDRPEEQFERALGPRVFAQARQAAAEVGLPIEFFAAFEPWFFTTTLTVMHLQRLGFLPQYGVDLHLFSRARAAGKRILALETIDEQLDLFDRMPVALQRELVRQTIDDVKLVSASLDALVKAWADGDQEGFASLSQRSMKNHPAVYNSLLRDRNRAWLPAIERYLKQKDDVLVVVGAAHLVGEDGLVRLLRSRGYTVEQL